MRLAPSVLLVGAFIAPIAYAQQDVRFSTVPTARFGAREDVEAVFTLPPGATGKVPAVILIHSSGGYDKTTYETYAGPLRQAGIATLSLILFRANRPRPPSQYIPHMYGAFKFLAAQPQIDATRIGVMGMSLGGLLGLYAKSEVLSNEALGNGGRFAAHAGLYPVCWAHEAIANGTIASAASALKGLYDKLTPAPALILAGAEDSYDDADGCQRFLAALPKDTAKAYRLTVFPRATHGWDQRTNIQFMDPYACKGKGCPVQVRSNPDVTAKGRDLIVSFFATALKTAH